MNRPELLTDPRFATAEQRLQHWPALRDEITRWLDGFPESSHGRVWLKAFEAGYEEQLVDNASHEIIAHELPDARHIVITGAKHEILMETDAIRAQFWDAFDQLAERVVPARV